MPNTRRIREEIEAGVKNAYLPKYEVRIRTYGEKGSWTTFFQAESFAHAEEQALPYLGKDEFISDISLDY